MMNNKNLVGNKVNKTPKTELQTENLKRVLRPIIKEILKEYSAKPTKVPDLEGVLEKYGIGDILATAEEFYKTKNERGSAILTKKLRDTYEKLLDYSGKHLEN